MCVCVCVCVCLIVCAAEAMDGVQVKSGESKMEVDDEKSVQYR